MNGVTFAAGATSMSTTSQTVQKFEANRDADMELIAVHCDYSKKQCLLKAVAEPDLRDPVVRQAHLLRWGNRELQSSLGVK